MNYITENIYIDESGNTGQDLLNQEQKVFVLATNNFSVEEIDILTSIFESKSELHFKKLRNSDSGRASIIQLLNHPLITEKNILCLTGHKEYATVGQIVDQIIEPVLYDNDIDIYQYGQNIALTNFIFSFGNHFWDKELFMSFLNSFVKMMRTKTEETINEFYKASKLLFNSTKTKERDLILPVLQSENQITDILERVSKYTIDLTLSSFYILCDLWYKKVNKKLNIFQDNSKQMEHYKEYIEFTKNLNIPKQEIGFDSRKITFPTQIEKMELVDSQNYLGVQISDLIASSIGFMYSNDNLKQKNFVEQIQNSKLLNLSNYYTIWPNSYVTPEELKMEKGEGQNVLDFLATEMIRNGM